MWPSYQEFRSLKVSEGRLISDEDQREGRRVLVLGSKAYRQLFPGQPAIGATVLVKSIPYSVVGVLEEKKQNSNYSGPDNDYLFAPYASVSRDFPPPEKPGAGITRGYLDDIVFEVVNPEEHEAAVLQVRRSIGRVRHFDPLDKDALFIWDTMDGAKQLARVFGVVTLFFGCVAIVTLCLGGIGVMNIMLVSVTERTREIGTRKAMGATKRDILRQFFAESAMLTIASGILGFSFGSRNLHRPAGAAPSGFRSSPDCFADFHCDFNFDPFVDYRDRRHVSSPARSGHDPRGVLTL